jgi:hypothetical protein
MRELERTEIVANRHTRSVYVVGIDAGGRTCVAYDLQKVLHPINRRTLTDLLNDLLTHHALTHEIDHAAGRNGTTHDVYDYHAARHLALDVDRMEEEGRTDYLGSFASPDLYTLPRENLATYGIRIDEDDAGEGAGEAERPAIDRVTLWGGGSANRPLRRSWLYLAGEADSVPVVAYDLRALPQPIGYERLLDLSQTLIDHHCLDSAVAYPDRGSPEAYDYRAALERGAQLYRLRQTSCPTYLGTLAPSTLYIVPELLRRYGVRFR